MNWIEILGIVFVAVVIFNVLFFIFMTRAAKLRKKLEEEERELEKKRLAVFHAEFFSVGFGAWCGWFRHEGIIKQGFVSNLTEHELKKDSCLDVKVIDLDNVTGRWKVEAIIADDED